MWGVQTTILQKTLLLGSYAISGADFVSVINQGVQSVNNVNDMGVSSLTYEIGHATE